jgi:hypothetical protein
MGVKISVFYPGLQAQMGNRTSVDVPDGTVRQCLSDLIRQFPVAERWLFDEKGRLLDQVFVYINAESSRRVGLSARVKDGDVLILGRMMIGG